MTNCTKPKCAQPIHMVTEARTKNGVTQLKKGWWDHIDPKQTAICGQATN